MPVPLLLYGTTVGGPETAPTYRVTGILLVPLAHRLHRPLSESFHHAHVPDGGFGIAFLEAPLAVATHITRLDVLRAYRAACRNGPATLDVSAGRTYPEWPTSAPWAGLHPARPWNVSGAGFVADLAGTTIYEDAAGGRSLVKWHCRRCHVTDVGHVNNGGPVRWAAAWQARRHRDRVHPQPGLAEPAGTCCDCARLAEMREGGTR